MEIAAARGDALDGDLDAIAGTSLDKGVELDALAKMQTEQRKPIIDRAKAGERVSVRKEPEIAADPLCAVMANEKRTGRLMDAEKRREDIDKRNASTNYAERMAKLQQARPAPI